MQGPHSHQRRPRLAFVGSMVGRHPGHITQQGQVLSDLFAESGYHVISVSSFLNRYRRLADIISTLIRRRDEIDIMVIEVYGGPSFVMEDIASWLGKRLRKRIVMWLHGGALPEFMARFPSWSKRVFSRADLIVTPSDFLARSVAGLGFRSRVIPNIIQLPLYPYRLRRSVSPRLFWMRNIQQIWNPLMAIRTLARLRNRFPDASLVMAGPDKGMKDEVEQTARSMGLGGSVRFTGFLDASGKIRGGGAADIYINTNRIDNTPVAVVEAGAMGLPVVTTNVGGIPDLLVDGDTGLFVSDDDDKAMSEAICHLIENPELAERLSRNGRRLAERFAWDEVRPQWQQLFAELAGDRLEESPVFSYFSSTP